MPAASEAAEHVLRIPPTYPDGESTILNVSSTGRLPLDVRLLATEGDNPYVFDMKHNLTQQLRDKKSPQTEYEWEQTLLYTLLEEHKLDRDDNIEGLETIELTASLHSRNLTLTFRKSLSGITQRLGAITLHESPDVELDTLDWTSVAVARSTQLERTIRDLDAKYKSANHIIGKLNAQLEELVKAKKEHEDEIVAKFAVLLNAKKAKIREQQSLLDARSGGGIAKVWNMFEEDDGDQEKEEDEATKVQPGKATRGRGKGKGKGKGKEQEIEKAKGKVKANAPKPTASGPNKRKTRAAAAKEPSESEEDDDLEPIAPKKNPKKDDKGAISEQIDRSEDSSTEEATEDSSEGDDTDIQGITGTGDIVGSGVVREQSLSTAAEAMDVDSAPPVRELPFTNGSGTSQGRAQAQSSQQGSAAREQEAETDGDDGNPRDDTTDDEL